MKQTSLEQYCAFGRQYVKVAYEDILLFNKTKGYDDDVVYTSWEDYQDAVIKQIVESVERTDQFNKDIGYLEAFKLIGII